MRLWTIHPKHLDTRGLVALWREALLAQKVLQGQTRGYRAHPQLQRFRAQAEPLAALSQYLQAVQQEAQNRGYRFDAAKILPFMPQPAIAETSGQLLYEWQHLLTKLQSRDPTHYESCALITTPDAHPSFCIVPGDVRDWEKRLVA